jgi:sigma-B regulation protein RsbU (phosphoserine phosphatase)
MSDTIKRLLVADPSVSSEFTEQMEQLGYTLQTATAGQEVLDIIGTNEFDLICLSTLITDHAVEDIVQRIKADEHWRMIPIFILFEPEQAELVLHCVELGADDYLVRPLNARMLDLRIKNTLIKRRTEAEQQRALLKAEKMVAQLEEVVVTMGITLSTEADFERLLERILIESKRVCNADAGTLYLRTEENALRFAIVITDSLGIRLGGSSGNPVTFPILPLYDEATGEPNYHNVTTFAALKGKSIIVEDAYEAEGFDFSGTKIFDKQNNYRTTSVLTVPLKDNNAKVIGVLQLINAQDHNGNIIPFDNYNRLVVESLAAQAAVVLNNHLLIEQKKMMSKIENDIQIARRIQLDFLPKSMPDVPGWHISGRFQPAREVAGDFYDVWMMMNNKRIGFMLGDVCDKGVGAALFMSLTRSLIRAFAMQSYNVNWAESLFNEGVGATAISRVSRQSIMASAVRTAMVNTNSYITEHHLDLNMFATVFFGMIDPRTGEVLYINGGHPGPMIISPTCDIKARLNPSGPAVGMFPDTEFVIQSAKLDPGDFLFVFSDGATDARNPAGKLIGEKGLIEMLMPPAPNVNALLDRIESRLINWIGSAVQFDDITMLAIQRE